MKEITEIFVKAARNSGTVYSDIKCPNCSLCSGIFLGMIMYSQNSAEYVHWCEKCNFIWSLTEEEYLRAVPPIYDIKDFIPDFDNKSEGE